MNILFLLTILFYILSTAGYFAYFFIQKENLQKTGLWFFIIGFLLYCFIIFLSFVKYGVVPVLNLSQTFIFTGWTISGVFLIFQRKYNLKILGIYTAPLVVFIIVTGYCLPSENLGIDNLFRNFWLILHIITIFVGESAFVLACGVGILYLVQEYSIKKKRHGFFFPRLPSLEKLDTTGYACIVFGFIFTTLGLITGIVYAKLVWGKFWSWDPKEIWSVITWFIYAILLHERIVAGWRGRRTAIIAIIGFVIMVFTFLGVNLLLSGHHGTFTR